MSRLGRRVKRVLWEALRMGVLFVGLILGTVVLMTALSWSPWTLVPILAGLFVWLSWIFTDGGRS